MARMHGGRRPNEKAKDFKGTMKKLIRYMAIYKVQVFFVAVFAICGTIFNIVGPKILGKATTEIFNGLVSKVSGGDGMNFGKIGQILLTVLCLYVISAICSFVQGYLMTGVSQKTTYRLRREISEKINRMPMSYFDTKPVGEVLSRVTNDVDTLGQSLNQSVTQMITSVTTLNWCIYHDVVNQPADDSDCSFDSSAFCRIDRIRNETFTEIFRRAADIPWKCEWTGRRNLWWS